MEVLAVILIIIGAVLTCWFWEFIIWLIERNTDD